MTKTINFFIGMFVGLLVGGLASILLAPKTGPEFRHDIQTDFEDLIKEVEWAVADDYILLE
jgi:gas vesicle protein